jgi:arsenate reductase (thioredoxin)
MTSQNLPKVLFVCVENSCRSQMAEAFARMHGKGKVEAMSAGSRPSGKVNPKAVESMAEVGYDLSCHVSQSVTEIPDVVYDAVVTMGCGDECPFVRGRIREDWKIPDPKDLPVEEFRKVREMIEEKVKKLLSQYKAL